MKQRSSRGEAKGFREPGQGRKASRPTSLKYWLISVGVTQLKALKVGRNSPTPKSFFGGGAGRRRRPAPPPKPPWETNCVSPDRFRGEEGLKIHSGFNFPILTALWAARMGKGGRDLPVKRSAQTQTGDFTPKAPLSQDIWGRTASSLRTGTRCLNPTPKGLFSGKLEGDRMEGRKGTYGSPGADLPLCGRGIDRRPPLRPRLP